MPALRLLPLLLLPALALPAAAKELWEYAWIEVRTPHFVIASALDEKRSVALAVDLERFRRATELVTNIGRFEERIPTKVYVLPRRAPDLGIDGVAVGLFMPAMRANYALVSPQGAESDEVLKHEYVHFLMHNRDSLMYPPWLDEGIAELLSTLRVEEDGALLEYGDALSWRVDSLVNGTWLGFDTVLSTRDASSLGRTRAPMFYAQAWFLVHYLMIGREGRDFAADTTSYLAAIGRGTPSSEAFEAAYGLAPKALARTLRAYVRKAKFHRTRLRQPIPRAEARVSAMRRDAIAAELGLIALSRGALEAAREYYEAALAANPDNALALVGSGDLHKHAGRFEEAVAHYEKAIALEPGEANHQLDYGEYFLQRASDERDPARRAELIAHARRRFARSYKLNPDNPETLDQNGLTYLVEDADVPRGIESLEAAHALLPSHRAIRFHLAQAYLAADQAEKARPHLLRLLALAHGEGAAAIEAMLQEIETAAAGASSERGAAASDGK